MLFVVVFHTFTGGNSFSSTVDRQCLFRFMWVCLHIINTRQNLLVDPRFLSFGANNYFTSRFVAHTYGRNKKMLDIHTLSRVLTAVSVGSPGASLGGTSVLVPAAFSLGDSCSIGGYHTCKRTEPVVIGAGGAQGECCRRRKEKDTTTARCVCMRHDTVCKLRHCPIPTEEVARPCAGALAIVSEPFSIERE